VLGRSMNACCWLFIRSEMYLGGFSASFLPLKDLMQLIRWAWIVKSACSRVKRVKSAEAIVSKVAMLLLEI
jgi:hypothetical protein